MLDSLRKLFGGGEPAPAAARPAPPPEPDADDEAVPEMSIEELRRAQSLDNPLVVVDVREPYEWRQVRLPEDVGFSVLYIAMNSIPEHLDELPRDQPLAILCAHGSRSYGVTHYLREQGFQAASVAGGITRWAIGGGAVTSGNG